MKSNNPVELEVDKILFDCIVALVTLTTTAIQMKLTRWTMKLKHEIPEVGHNQYVIFERLVNHILGDDVDTQALVRAGHRQLAKDGFAVNERLKQQRNRLREVLGIPAPPKPDRNWVK